MVGAQDSGLYTCHVQEKQMAMGISGLPPPAVGVWGAARPPTEAQPGSAKGEAHSGVDGGPPATAVADRTAHVQQQQQKELERAPRRALSDDATPSNKSEAGSMQSSLSGQFGQSLFWPVLTGVAHGALVAYTTEGRPVWSCVCRQSPSQRLQLGSRRICITGPVSFMAWLKL